MKRAFQLVGLGLVFLILLGVLALGVVRFHAFPTEESLPRPSDGSIQVGTRGAAASMLSWTRQFGSNSNDFGNAVAVVGSESYVAGSTFSTLPGETSAGYIDAFVRKYDAMGEVEWTRQFGASYIDEALAVAADPFGVYVAGYTDHALPGQSTAGGNDAFLRRYDASGTEEWTHQFGTPGSDVAMALVADESGVYVAGATDGTLPGQTNLGVGDSFVRRYDLFGRDVWTRQFGTSNDDGAISLAVEGSSAFVAGYTAGAFPGQTNQGGFDLFVRAYDGSGGERWTRQTGTIADDLPYGIAANSSKVYVAGLTFGALAGETNQGDRDAFLQSYDDLGEEGWHRQFGTPAYDIARAVTATAFGVYVGGLTAGALPGQTNAGQFEDAFIRKYDAFGSERWTRQFGTESGDAAFAIAVDGSGVYLAGYTFGSFPGQETQGGPDAFLARVIETPDAPSLLEISSGDRFVDLTWIPPISQGGSPVTSYRIHRGTTAGSLTYLAEVGMVERYRDAGLTNGVTYYYVVYAVNSVGEGLPSAEAHATPSPDVTPPAIAIMSPADGAIFRSATVTVTGTVSDDVAVDKVEVSMDGATWVTAAGTSSWSVTLTLHPGSNSMIARATDTSGNTATATVSITVELPSPSPGGTSLLYLGLLVSEAIIVAGLVLALYLFKRRGRRGMQPPAGAAPPTP